MWAFFSKLLEQNGVRFAGLCFAALLAYLAIKFGYLDHLPPVSRDFALLAGIVFGALALASACASTFTWFRKRRAVVLATRERNGLLLGYLDTLSPEEHAVLSYLVQRNQQTFNAHYFRSPEVTNLSTKGLIRRGAGMADNVPFTVAPLIWQELMLRRAEFNSADLDGPPPWRRDWRM